MKRKNIFKYEDTTTELKVLKNREGKVVFVGSFRQVKRRLKKVFRWMQKDNLSPMVPLDKNNLSIPSDGTSPLNPTSPRLLRTFGRGEWLQAAELPLIPSLEKRGNTATNAQGAFLLWEAAQIGYTIERAEMNYNNNDNVDKLKEKLKDIPKKPGVYQFKNKDGEVIYVGKAKDLRNRVGQYLGGKDDRPQLPYLMAEAADVDYTVVNNELESLFLENTLIKQYLPKYNIQLRDDKNYAFITIDYNCEIPKIAYARKVDKQSKHVKYFGPYSAAYKIRNTLNLMRRIFPYCAADKVSSRPCFYYYLHRCPGVCIGKISLEEYKVQLDRICTFLSGNAGKIKKEIEVEMHLAASSEQFEKAARLRDQVQALQLLEEKQVAILPKAVNWDVISLSTDQGYACVNLFKVREGKLFDKENFVYELADPDLQMTSGSTGDCGTIVQNFLEQYYLDASNVAEEIYVEYAAEDKELIEHIVKSRFNKTSHVITPQRGKARELIELGKTNAEEHLKNWLTTQAEHLDKVQSSLKELQTVLGLPTLPERIECYDISNIQGTNPVGSMVVFKNGMPCKSEYRKFKIKTKSTPDDFAMMKEMLVRRLSRVGENFQDPNDKFQINPNNQDSKTKWPRPDLIVIDGGKGQLGVAVEVLKEKNCNIPVIGLAKRIEEIFLPEKSEPILLSQDNPALKMLQRLRDEAHRFGISFHRDLRSKQAVKSALDDIPGIGPKTKKLLKEKFGTVANIRKASIEELAAVVGERIAQTIQANI